MRTNPDIVASISVGARTVQVDEQGFLIDPDTWDEDIAREMAHRLGLVLTDDHWAVITFMRDYLAEHGLMADARFAMRFLEPRARERGLSGRALLFELFPYGYVGQACRISGMRQPRAWSTG
ncbi:MAG: TusE/DsrC/DsvC family sulfur relay protein [Burkholderiaceae bacterium]